MPSTHYFKDGPAATRSDPATVQDRVKGRILL